MGPVRRRGMPFAIALWAACGGGGGGGQPPADSGPERDAEPDATDAGGTDGGPDLPDVLVAGGEGRFQAECDVAAAGDVVVVGFMDGKESSIVGAANAGMIYLAVSRDGGLQFGEPFAVDDSRPVDQFDPTVAIGVDEHTVVGWFEDDGAGGRHVRVAIADAPEGPYVTGDPLDTGDGEVDRPWLAMSGDRVLAAWVVAPSHRIDAAVSDDGGGTFAAPVSTSTDGMMLGCVAVGPDGTFWAVANAYEGAFAAEPALFASAWLDGEGSFDAASELGRLSRPGRVIARCAATNGGLAVVWPDSTGTLLLDAPDLLEADLWLARVDLEGHVTREAIPAPAGSAPLLFPPAVAAAEDGRLGVTFYARRTDGETYDADWEVFASFASAGAPPGAPERVSPRPAPGMRLESLSPVRIDATRWLGDTSGLVAVPDAWLAVYSENRTGDADLFATRLP